MATTWKKGMLLLGLATAVSATPVMGIEVRHRNLTSPICDFYHAIQLLALSSAGSPFLCSISRVWFRTSLSWMWHFYAPSSWKKSANYKRGPPRVHLLVFVESRWVWHCDSIVRSHCELGPGQSYSHILSILNFSLYSKIPTAWAPQLGLLAGNLIWRGPGTRSSRKSAAWKEEGLLTRLTLRRRTLNSITHRSLILNILMVINSLSAAEMVAFHLQSSMMVPPLGGMRTSR